MARSKKKRGTSKEAYRSIRKPVPPPTRVQKDRRKRIREDIERRESRAKDEGREDVS